MCLQLKDSDFMQYSRLLDEGIAICERAAKEQGMRKYSSLRELLETFRGENPFPVELSIQGDEPEFAKSLYEVVQKVIKEAYHNTLSHSLADNLTIEARMDEFALTLRVFDNGTFHGAFERGFGLKSMEENVIASGGMFLRSSRRGRRLWNYGGLEECVMCEKVKILLADDHPLWRRDLQ